MRGGDLNRTVQNHLRRRNPLARAIGDRNPSARVLSVVREATTRVSALSPPRGSQGRRVTRVLDIKTVGKVIGVVAAADLPAAEVGSRVPSSSSSSSSRASGVSEGLALDPAQPQGLLPRNGQCR